MSLKVNWQKKKVRRISAIRLTFAFMNFDYQPIKSRQTWATTKVTINPKASGNNADTVVHRLLPVSL